MISAFDEFLTRLFFKLFNFGKKSLWSWLILGIVSFLILIILLVIFRIELHDVVGISETVDTVLTGQRETIIGKTIVHTQN